MSTEPICPRPSFLMGVVGQSQPSVGWEETNRVHWQVSTKPACVHYKSICLTYIYVSLPFDVDIICQEKRFSGHGRNFDQPTEGSFYLGGGEETYKEFYYCYHFQNIFSIRGLYIIPAYLSFWLWLRFG